jgi:hypothetical protein
MVTLRLKKSADGSSALTFIRADGSATWQRQKPAHAGFFPYHDLTHFVVESELGFRRAFCGLVAEGWNFDDFRSPWPRGPLAGEAMLAEAIVGILDLDRAMVSHSVPPASADDVHARLVEFYLSRGAPAPTLVLDDRALVRIRQRLAELFARWKALPAGEALDLRFGEG